LHREVQYAGGMSDAPRPPRLTVWDGLAIACGGLALLVLIGVALATPRFEAMFKDMGGAKLPAVTRLLLRGGLALRIGAPLGLLIAFVMAFLRRPPVAVRVGVAVLIACVTVGWLIALYAPIFSLAGNISE
jgi:hypothetical protein